MKESASAALPVPDESPEERKRRLARERQRRHREKLRANKQRLSDSTNAAASRTLPSNPDRIHPTYRSNSIARPSPRSDSAQNHRSGDPPNSSAQHAHPALHSTPPHPSASAPLPRHNSSLVHASAADPPKPLVDTTAAAASRIDTSVPPSNHPSPPSVYAAKHAHSLSSHDHRTASHLHQQKLQLQYNQTQPLHQSLQTPHQPHSQASHIASSAPRIAGNHLLHQPSHHHHHLTQQQPNHQVRRMHQVHHPATQSSHHTKPTPAAPTSLSQPTQQPTLKHPHHSQIQRPYGANVHLHPQPFTQVSHAFPTPYISPHPSQPHATPADNPFNFQTTTNDPTLQPHGHVADAQRSYLNDLPPRDQHQYSRYTSPRMRQPSQQTDASTAITAINQSLPPAVNGAHPSLPNPSAQSNPPPTPVRMPSSINRDATGNRYSQSQPTSQTLTPPLQSQVPSTARDSNHENSQPRNTNETAEERKRRLARERQRRRRKRLKLDPQTNPNQPHVDTSSHVEEQHREAGASSQNVPIDINIHVRPAADNPIQMPSSAIQPTLHTSFEPSNLASNNHSTLQPLQVAPVTATQEDLHVSNAAGRNAYNSHPLTVGSAPNVSNGVSSSHRAAADLARMSGASDERIMRPNEPDEDPEARKRRLARERQRRRRQRLKEKRIEEADKTHGQQSQALKYEPTQTRIVDGVEANRNHPDLDRRTIPGDPITDTVRMPLSAAPANVFGPRSDVTANMPFEQQSRLVRNAGTSGMPESTVPPMPLSFNGSNGINLGAMPVNNVMGSLNLVHWSQGFENESAARFAVDAAVGAFRAHLGGSNPNAKAYVLQQGILMLSAEEGGRELINGQILASLRADGVMRIG